MAIFSRGIFFAFFLLLLGIFTSASVVMAEGKGPQEDHMRGIMSRGKEDHMNNSSQGALMLHEMKHRMEVGSVEGRMEDHHATDSAKSNRVKQCVAINKMITTRSKHLNDLVLHMEQTFDSIAQGVETRYTTTDLPAGKTVPSYDLLVAAIAQQKDMITPLLTSVQTEVSLLSCDASNPRAQVQKYRSDMHAVQNGLQAYKRAVRNLIVAVAKAEGTQGTDSSHEASGSAE